MTLPPGVTLNDIDPPATEFELWFESLSAHDSALLGLERDGTYYHLLKMFGDVYEQAQRTARSDDAMYWARATDSEILRYLRAVRPELVDSIVQVLELFAHAPVGQTKYGHGASTSIGWWTGEGPSADERVEKAVEMIALLTGEEE